MSPVVAQQTLHSCATCGREGSLPQLTPGGSLDYTFALSWMEQHGYSLLCLHADCAGQGCAGTTNCRRCKSRPVPSHKQPFAY